MSDPLRPVTRSAPVVSGGEFAAESNRGELYRVSSTSEKPMEIRYSLCDFTGCPHIM